jgi:hypothetical protein
MPAVLDLHPSRAFHRYLLWVQYDPRKAFYAKNLYEAEVRHRVVQGIVEARRAQRKDKEKVGLRGGGEVELRCGSSTEYLVQLSPARMTAPTLQHSNDWITLSCSLSSSFSDSCSCGLGAATDFRISHPPGNCYPRAPYKLASQDLMQQI